MKKHPLIAQVLWLLAAALVPAIATAIWHPHRPVWNRNESKAPETTLDGVRSSRAPILWVDARKPEAFAAGHMPGAVSLNEDRWHELLPAFVSAWTPEHRVVVIPSAFGGWMGPYQE